MYAPNKIELAQKQDDHNHRHLNRRKQTLANTLEKLVPSIIESMPTQKESKQNSFFIADLFDFFCHQKVGHVWQPLKISGSKPQPTTFVQVQTPPRPSMCSWPHEFKFNSEFICAKQDPWQRESLGSSIFEEVHLRQHWNVTNINQVKR